MENAIAIIDKANKDGALVYATPHLSTPALYRAEATVIGARQDEFTDVGGGKYMPGKAVVDRIGDAAGIDFVAEVDSVRTEVRDDETVGKRTVFIGRCQGKVRLSDGSWRASSVEEYEFDPYIRAALDAKGDKTKELRLRLEYQKFPRQRAASGARLRVIKQLTGMPTAFSGVEVKRIVEHGAAFSRIVKNTDYILGTADGRRMAIAEAIRGSESVYGPSESIRDVTPRDEPVASLPAPAPAAATSSDDDPFAPVAPDPEPEPEADPTLPPRVAEIRTALIDWANSDIKEVAERAEAILGRDERDVDVLEVSLELVKYLGARCLKPEGARLCIEALTNTPRDLIILRSWALKAKGAYEARVEGKKAS